MTEQKHRYSDIVADQSIDAAWGAVLLAGLWPPYYIVPYHKCTVLPTMSDQCQLMTNKLLVCSDILTKILIIHTDFSVGSVRRDRV